MSLLVTAGHRHDSPFFQPVLEKVRVARPGRPSPPAGARVGHPFRLPNETDAQTACLFPRPAPPAGLTPPGRRPHRARLRPGRAGAASPRRPERCPGSCSSPGH